MLVAEKGQPRRGAARRSGKILVMFALLLAVLLGMVGLVCDGGVVMLKHRQAQNAADSAALAAAMELYRGASESKAHDAAMAFVMNHNTQGGSAEAVTVNFGANISELSPAKHRRPGYVEVVVDMPSRTFFIQVLGGQSNLRARARAVAGFETVTKGEGAIALDPRAKTPGLSLSGGALLHVTGAVIVNARGKGIDQNTLDVNSDYNHYGISTGNNSRLYTTYLQAAGGVDILDNIYDFADYPNTPGLSARTNPYPLFARAPLAPDPLRTVPIPQLSGQSAPYAPIKVANGETRTLTPGIYSDIQVDSGGTAVFEPGIYVLMPTNPNQGLRFNGASTVRGEGVMFYVTGSDYLSGPTPGFYDVADGEVAFDFGTDDLPPPPPGENINKVHFATVDINASDGNIHLTGIATPGSPYKDILFFQRRRNPNTMQIQSSAGPNVTLNGTVYAKWAQLKLSGGGRYDAMFVVGTLDVSGNATFIIDSGGKTFGVANQVFLIE